MFLIFILFLTKSESFDLLCSPPWSTADHLGQIIYAAHKDLDSMWRHGDLSDGNKGSFQLDEVSCFFWCGTFKDIKTRIFYLGSELP